MGDGSVYSNYHVHFLDECRSIREIMKFIFMRLDLLEVRQDSSIACPNVLLQCVKLYRQLQQGFQQLKRNTAFVVVLVIC